MIPLQVLGDRILVALPPKVETQEATTGYTYQQEETTASGIILAKPADVFNVEIATRGIVVQLGEKKTREASDETLMDLFDSITLPGPKPGERVAYRDEFEANLSLLRRAPFEVAVGDCVVFPPSAGEAIELEEITYVILREADVIGIVLPNSEAA